MKNSLMKIIVRFTIIRLFKGKGRKSKGMWGMWGLGGGRLESGECVLFSIHTMGKGEGDENCPIYSGTL